MTYSAGEIRAAEDGCESLDGVAATKLDTLAVIRRRRLNGRSEVKENQGLTGREGRGPTE